MWSTLHAKIAAARVTAGQILSIGVCLADPADKNRVNRHRHDDFNESTKPTSTTAFP
jgi:hypothetical protein